MILLAVKKYIASYFASQRQLTRLIKYIRLYTDAICGFEREHTYLLTLIYT